jgi:hypothetical protein
MYRIIVCKDMSYLLHYYQQAEKPNSQLKVINCKQLSDKNYFTDLYNISANQGSFCVVLLNAHLLSEANRCTVATAYLSAGIKLVFAVTHLSPDDLVLRIQQPNSQLKFTVKVIVPFFPP